MEYGGITLCIHVKKHFLYAIINILMSVCRLVENTYVIYSLLLMCALYAGSYGTPAALCWVKSGTKPIISVKIHSEGQSKPECSKVVFLVLHSLLVFLHTAWRDSSCYHWDKKQSVDLTDRFFRKHLYYENNDNVLKLVSLHSLHGKKAQ